MEAMKTATSKMPRVDGNGNITGWLNELAFVPTYYNKNAMVDEWLGDYGCGVKYFSQDAVIKLAPAAVIKLNENASLAEKLKDESNHRVGQSIAATSLPDIK